MSDTDTKPGVANGLGDGVLRASREVWLAGLGAVVTVGEEASSIFQTLVDKGKSVELRPDKMPFEKAFAGVTDQIRQLNQRIEGGLQDASKAVLHRFGVPSHAEVRTLIEHVDQLSRKIETISRKEGVDVQET